MLAKELESRCAEQRIHLFAGSGESLYYFQFGRSSRVYFCLDGQLPRVYLSNQSSDLPPSSGQFALQCKKSLSNALVTGCRQIGGDRIIAFDFIGLDEVFHERKLTLVAELIPTKANLILLDEDGKIEAAHRYMGLNEKRPIVKGLIYEAPERKFASEEQESFDFDLYCQECERLENEIRLKALKQKYAKLFSFVTNKAKSAKRKITMIQNDIEEAKKHIGDGEYGTYIFMHLDEINPSTGSMDYYGTPIPLDKTKSVSANAEMFFKRQKKAKASLNNGEANLSKAQEEMKRFQRLVEILPFCSENGLRELSIELGCTPAPKKGKKTATTKYAESLLPHEIIHGGITYWYGTNARQNDFLSFALDTEKDHLWMHVKGNHGAHLIIRKANPTDAEISFGCEICLLASGLNDGEVMYCPKSNVRKGSVPGQAIVKEYRSAFFRSVSKQAKEAYQQARRAKQ